MEVYLSDRYVWRCTCLTDIYGGVPVWLLQKEMYLSDWCIWQCTCLIDANGAVSVWLKYTEAYLSDWYKWRCTCFTWRYTCLNDVYGESVPVWLMYIEKMARVVCMTGDRDWYSSCLVRTTSPATDSIQSWHTRSTRRIDALAEITSCNCPIIWYSASAKLTKC